MPTMFARDAGTSVRPRRRRWLRRTGDRLRFVLAVTLAACLLGGIAGSLEITAQRRALTEIAAQRGPLAISAAEVYRSLADADAASSVALLGGALESGDLRDRYLRDIATANAALSTAAAGSPTSRSAGVIAELANHIPTYTGLIETARANHRQGLLVGVAYFRQASELLRAVMLPAAQRLHRLATDELTTTQAEAARWPVVGMLLTGSLVLWLVAVQVYLRRLTRRRLNRGLLVATLLTLTAGTWLAVAGGVAAHHSESSRQDGSRQLEILAEARIRAALTLGDEALSVASEGDETGHYQQSPDRTPPLAPLDRLLAQARAEVGHPDSTSEVAKAADIAEQWLTVHEDLTERDTSQHAEAVTIVAGPDQNSAVNLAAAFDRHIATAAARATERFDADIQAAREALPGVGLAVLGSVVVLAVVAGMTPRIREYWWSPGMRGNW